MDAHAQKNSRKRKKLIVDAQFQYRFIRRIALMAVCITTAALLAMAYIYQSYGHIEIMVSQPLPFDLSDEEALKGSLEADNIFSLLWPVLLASIAITSAITITMGAFISHRLAGPVYRLRQEIQLILSGDLRRSIGLRDKDEFGSLAADLEQLRVKLSNHIQELDALCQNRQAPPEPPPTDSKTASLKKIVDSFEV